MFYVLSACSEIPCPVFDIAHIIVQLIKFVVPVVLIFMGMLDFTKATMAQDENGIAEAKKSFIKRLIAACCVFFVFVILQFVFNILAMTAEGVEGGQDGKSVWSCVESIFSGNIEPPACNDDEFGNGSTGNNNQGQNNGQ